MHSTALNLEQYVDSELPNLRSWANEFQRLTRETKEQVKTIRELEMELEVLRDLVKVTSMMLVEELGPDADLEVMRHLAKEWQHQGEHDLH